MTILTEFPGIEGSAEYLLFAFYHNDIDHHIFINFRHIELVWISRDLVLLFPGSTTMMLGFQASYSPIFCDFVLFF